ncbi:hypothetical protein HOLleu_15125 [Holothuria leucospilota]|uniref:N-acetyltransferase domain-containing protein n=1 Tax=Holothuria leucospilota TaxID=206669 RepID=A0A9Q1HCX8_HOLLE|nr:hypothetical protein HOLleu_15125 [Holothuria leucospilota]
MGCFSISDVLKDYRRQSTNGEASDDNTITDGSFTPDPSPYGSLKSPYDDLYSLEYNQINGSFDTSEKLSAGDFVSSDVNFNKKHIYSANNLKKYVSTGTQKDGPLSIKKSNQTGSLTKVQESNQRNVEEKSGNCEHQENIIEKDPEETQDGSEKKNNVESGKTNELENEKHQDEDTDGRVENKKGKFADVFSDTESDDSSSSESEDEVDFSKGAELFLQLVKERREKRKQTQEADLSLDIGIESRLVGCATWEKSHVCPGEHVIQIDLLAVRRRYRKSGVGKYLLQKLKDPSMVGVYDSLVVYADHSAVDFFSGYGFSDDIVLNSKFSELDDNWTNCTLMCYLPPFTGQTVSHTSNESLDLKAMELEIQKWTLKSREAYQAQFGCLMRLRHEVIALRALVSSQQDVIESLTSQVDLLLSEKQDLEKKNLLQRVLALKAGVDLDGFEESPDTGYHEWDECEGGEEGANLDTNSLIQDLERRVREMGTESDVEGDEELIDWTVAEEFAFAMREDSLLGGNITVTKTKKAQPSQHTVDLYSSWCEKLSDPSMKTKMYFCGSLTHPERIHSILENGFSSLDFTCGDFGMGLYFSKHPSTAAHFSALGKLLLVEVTIGKAETITCQDKTRTAPTKGYDSIFTQGRLHQDEKTSTSVRSRQQEYVIFHPSQALPLYLLEYKSV